MVFAGQGVLNVRKLYEFKVVSGFQGCWADEALTASLDRGRGGESLESCVLAR